MSPQISVGVIGLGTWGKNQLLAFDDYHKSRVDLVCDQDEKRAREVAIEYGCEWTTDVREAASSDVDVFGVATPDFAHFEPCRALLEANKHVFVEKPLTTDLAEAEQLAHMAENSRGLSMVDYHLRWDPRWYQIKEAVEQDRIGKPFMGYIRLSDAVDVAQKWLSWSGRSGPEWFLFPHIMDLMRWIVTEEPTAVYARGHRGILENRGISAWDSVQALVSYDNCQITFETSWVVPNSNPSVLDGHMSLYGESGKIDCDHDYEGLALSTDRYEYPWAPLGRKNRYGELDHYIYGPMRYFIDCVEMGRTPECSFADGLSSVQLVDAVTRSLNSSEVVTLSPSRNAG